MSLDDEYTEYLNDKPRNCKVCKWLGEQNEETQQFFTRRGPDNGAKMARFCQEKLGLKANETTVRKHFNENHAVA